MPRGTTYLRWYCLVCIDCTVLYCCKMACSKSRHLGTAVSHGRELYPPRLWSDGRPFFLNWFGTMVIKVSDHTLLGARSSEQLQNADMHTRKASHYWVTPSPRNYRRAADENGHLGVEEFQRLGRCLEIASA